MAVSMSAALPGHVVLAPGESVVAQEAIAVSLILFFMSSVFVLTDRRIAGEGKNTFLGVIPVGASRLSYPLNNIASVGTSTRVNVLGILLGVVCVLAGLKFIPLLLIGLLLLAGAFQAVLEITNNGGKTMKHNVAIFQKSKAIAFAAQVNTTIAARG